MRAGSAMSSSLKGSTGNKSNQGLVEESPPYTPLVPEQWQEMLREFSELT
jgi:hypothetical protein